MSVRFIINCYEGIEEKEFPLSTFVTNNLEKLLERLNEIYTHKTVFGKIVIMDSQLADKSHAEMTIGQSPQEL